MPHRPTKGLSVFDCLFLPPAATTENLFGNLRAKILGFSWNTGFVSLTASFFAEKARQDAVDIDRQNGYNEGKTKRGEKQYEQIYGRDF